MPIDRYPFELAPLPYAHNALEPNISARTMHFHHDKHLQAYTDNLNKALQGRPELQKMSLVELLSNPDRLPSDVRTAIMRNAGGVYNHILYFSLLRPPTRGNRPTGMLLEAIKAESGSFEEFQKEFKSNALAVFGSGYLWLISDSQGRLMLFPTANQQTPISEGFCPVLTIDVWEHAYYLDYQNRRGDYIDAWWDIVNWPAAEKEYLKCKGSGRGANIRI